MKAEKKEKIMKKVWGNSVSLYYQLFLNFPVPQRHIICSLYEIIFQIRNETFLRHKADFYDHYGKNFNMHILTMLRKYK